MFDDVNAPDRAHAITDGATRTIAMPVFGALRVSAAVELDNQAPLTTNALRLTLPGQQGWKSGGVAIDRPLLLTLPSPRKRGERSRQAAPHCKPPAWP
jgi:hypothetical protein